MAKYGLGSDIILTYRSNPEEGAKIVAEVEKLGHRAIALYLDVSNSASFNETTEEQFDTLVNIHLKGAITALLTPANRWVNAQRIEVSGDMFI